MKRTVLGIIIAAIVLYIWGFIYWGFGPYSTMIWKKSTDDVAAGKALQEFFPQNGTYFVPSFDQDQKLVETLYEEGPVAYVHMLSINGRPIMADFSNLIQGFFLNLVVIILIAILLNQVCTSLPGYLDRVKFVALAGLISAIFYDCGDAVWWMLDWSWELYQAFYGFSAWLVIGLILAKFIEPEMKQDSPT
ncbi:hypothetical protein [Gimesia aquarii]|uniref:Uncharacterized protein n=1 Tax=Gimesia aquarii TaxID=2527964 RepID=A0A517WR37_9PLAN|nr:hypothetical protein [Gimesia aquarii]QDU07709.1 hypothetical protein V202x_10700 [Gimesia aquarii]